MELGIGVSVDTLGLLPRLDTLPIRWGVVLPEFLSFSTQVKVTPPSLLLSLNRSRKVPGGFVLRMARSRSLLMKPMMYLQPRTTGHGLAGGR